MVSHTLTAAIILAKNGYSDSDLSYINCEYLIDDAIDFINGKAHSSIPNLSGAVAGSKTVTVTGYNENAALAFLLTMMLREAKKTSLTNSSSTSGSSSQANSMGLGPASMSESSSVGTAISAASSINNEANSPEAKFFWEAMAELHNENAGDIEAELA